MSSRATIILLNEILTNMGDQINTEVFIHTPADRPRQWLVFPPLVTSEPFSQLVKMYCLLESRSTGQLKGLSEKISSNYTNQKNEYMETI